MVAFQLDMSTLLGATLPIFFLILVVSFIRQYVNIILGDQGNATINLEDATMKYEELVSNKMFIMLFIEVYYIGLERYALMATYYQQRISSHVKRILTSPLPEYYLMCKKNQIYFKIY
jgi:hypothetical protein